jgi:hypothetical protein
MPRAPHVPAGLTGAPFTAADAARHGLTRDHLRSRAWRRVYRDVFAHVDLEDTPAFRVAAVRLTVPEGTVVAGATAAWLFGVLTPRPDHPFPLHVATRRGSHHVRLTNARASRLELDDDEIVQLDGVLATSPARTCLDLSRQRDLTEGVVAVDAFLASGLVTVEALWRCCAERRSWPGIDLARRAVMLSSDRSRSPGETRLRMTLVLGGLPEPLVNVTVHDTDGRPVGTPDLLYLHPSLGIEYDGAYHREADAHQVDIRRENRLLVRGLPLLRYSAHDLSQRRSQIVREVGESLRRLA